MWGNFADEQCGHTLRAGTESLQADARRLRLFDLLVFFFGTAMKAPDFSIAMRLVKVSWNEHVQRIPINISVITYV